MRRWLIGLLRMALIVPVMGLVLSGFTLLMDWVYTNPYIIGHVLAICSIAIGAWVVGPSDPKEGFIPKWED